MFRHSHFHDGNCGHGRDRGIRGMGRGSFDAHGGRSRRGGGRFFDQGDLRLVILSLLAEAPSHGYQVIRTIEERTGGAYAPSPGVVYPTLTFLEEEGLIEQSGADGARKLYAVTEAGAKLLEAQASAIKAFEARFQDAGGRGGFSPRVLRARENLRTALKLKLTAGALDEAQVEAIVTALDEAARAVESA
jgi:DNA-binding PadR family transcriptional regulator